MSREAQGNVYLHGPVWWFRWQRICLQCRSPGFHPWVRKIPLEKRMATHSSILAWEISWTEEPRRLESMVLQRVGHYWATNSFTFHQFIIKNIIKDTEQQPGEEMNRARSRMVPSTGACGTRELEYAISKHMDVFTNLEAHQVLLFKSF